MVKLTYYPGVSASAPLHGLSGIIACFSKIRVTEFGGTNGANWFSCGEQAMSRGSRAVASPHVVSIGDFRPLARLRLPRPVFDYLDGGADGEVTLRENCRVFDDVTFRPRYAVPVSDCDLRTRVLGFEVSFPALLAPVGYSRLMHPDGEAGAARAAGAAGTAYILSTISGHRVEDVKAASSGPVCFQLVFDGRPRGFRSRD